MKNNKGFTLIELIATIGIMLLIGLVIINNMSGILSKQQDQEYESFKKKLEDGACIYVELDQELRDKCKTNGCTIAVQDLIENGYIEDNLKDPSTGKLIISNPGNYEVNVRWDNYIKTCTMNG